MVLRRTTLVLIAVLHVVLALADETQESPFVIQAILTPDQSLNSQRMHWNETFIYAVEDLDPVKIYEVRISYPSILSAGLSIREIFPHNPTGVHHTSLRHRRLNADKVILENHSVSTARRYVSVAMERHSHSPSPFIQPQDQLLVFNIVVEENPIRGIPSSALRIVPVVCFWSGIMYWIIGPFFSAQFHKTSFARCTERG